MFHRRCGDRVNLINNNTTAERNFSTYDYGRVLSAEALNDDEIFEIRIDKKIVSWSGSIDIGVTTCDPETTELPAWVTSLQANFWLMTRSGIFHDSDLITDPSYGARSATLEEGNTLGVMKTSDGELIFFINGESQGVAATNIPSRVFAVVDMYGDCVQVTITRPKRGGSAETGSSPEGKEEIEANNDFPDRGEASNSGTSGIPVSGPTTTTNVVANLNVNLNVNMNVNLPKNPSIAAIREDRLRFHERVGTLVKLSNNARTAERRRPLDEFNNGVVMTHRQLRDNELFEIRIDRLVQKWSGSIEVGVTTHSPTGLEFPPTMTNMRSGTTMMSGCGILTNGKGIQREYGEINLDELREGDRVGMIRRGNGNLHYLINGLDQGVAAKVPPGVWGVVELYGMTVKVTIVDRDEREEQNLVTRRKTLHLQGLEEVGDDEPIDRLTFHPCCGTHADVINNGRTAHRPNAMGDFNNGVVLTMRPLRANELFEVRLDKIVTKWAGSIEIGVTTHSPTELEFPFTMTNVRSGTWIMTGSGVMHNGTTIIEQYGQNLDRLQVGDRIGVMRKDNATIHFYVNGSDQGAAAVGVPERVYGVIDLYGQATQASIVDNTDFYSPTTNNSSFSNTTLYSDLRFHHVHGKHARITNNGLTASRIRALGEFNEAIVIANRSLRDGELFEVSIDKMVGRWSGAIEAGVTAIRPDELEFPSTMTDIDHDTWMLSGSTVMRDGVTLRNHYACDLDKLTEGNRIGMMRCADSSLHYYLDGVDQGAACTGLPAHVYPVIDLYAQCAQVTIVLPERRDTMTQQYLPSENSTSQQPTSVLQPQPQTEIVHKFHQSAGLCWLLNTDRFVAERCKTCNSAILLSEIPLESNEMIEITIEEVAPEWSGSLKVGVLGNESGNWFTSMGLVPGLITIPPEAWYLSGNEVRHRGDVLYSNYSPSLDWLREDDKIGLKRTHDGNLKFYINGEDMGVAASNIPEQVHAIVELFGSTIAVSFTSSKQQSSLISPNASLRLQDSLELLLDPMPPAVRNENGADTSMDGSEAKLSNEIVLTPTQPISSSTGEIDWGYEFHENHGRNVELERKTTARRVASYNQGVLMSSRPLIKGKMFQVQVDKITDRWVSGVLCGITCVSPEKASFPLTALGFKKHSWIICSDWMSHNGTKIKTRYGGNLENLEAGSTIGLLVDEDSRLRLVINGVDQGVAAIDVPNYVYAIIDLYGQCEQISIIGGGNNQGVSNEPLEAPFMSNDEINMAIASTQERMGQDGPGESSEPEDIENSREKADLECHEKENRRSIDFPMILNDLGSQEPPEVGESSISGLQTRATGSIPNNNSNSGIVENFPGKSAGNEKKSFSGQPEVPESSISGLQTRATGSIPNNNSNSGIVENFPGKSAGNEKKSFSGQPEVPESSISGLQTRATGSIPNNNSNSGIVENFPGKSAGNEKKSFSSQPEVPESSISGLQTRATGSIPNNNSNSGIVENFPGKSAGNEKKSFSGQPEVPESSISGLQIRATGSIPNNNSNSGIVENFPGKSAGNEKKSFSGQPEVPETSISGLQTRATGSIPNNNSNSGIVENFPGKSAGNEKKSFSGQPEVPESSISGLPTRATGSIPNNNSNSGIVENFPGKSAGNEKKSFSGQPEVPESSISGLQTRATGSIPNNNSNSGIVENFPGKSAGNERKSFSGQPEVPDGSISGLQIRATGSIPNNNSNSGIVENFPGKSAGNEKKSFSSQPEVPESSISGLQTRATGSIPNNNSNSGIVENFPGKSAGNEKKSFSSQPEVPELTSGIEEEPSNECTSVEINNATNINIRNGSVATSSNMTNLNSAINSTNANNAINESIASNAMTNSNINGNLAGNLNNSQQANILPGNLNNSQQANILPGNLNNSQILAGNLNNSQILAGNLNNSQISAGNLNNSQMAENSRDSGLNLSGNNQTGSADNSIILSPNGINSGINLQNILLPDNCISNIDIVDRMTSGTPENHISDSQSLANRLSTNKSENNVFVTIPNQQITDSGGQIDNSAPPIGRISSAPTTPVISHGQSHPANKCEYFKACMRLKKSLVLPDEFFSNDPVVCYCNSCYKIDTDIAIAKKGEPPAEFAIPIGWTRFPLKSSINAVQYPHTTTDKWHVAFYGTRLDSIRWILDRGELLTKEQLDTSNLTTIIDIEDQNPQVVFSPNIKNVAGVDSTRKYPYIDTQSNRKLNVSTAFQLLVRPGSYTMGPGKDASDSQLESTEWATKEAGATVIVALLIHLDDF